MKADYHSSHPLIKTKCVSAHFNSHVVLSFATDGSWTGPLLQLISLSFSGTDGKNILGIDETFIWQGTFFNCFLNKIYLWNNIEGSRNRKITKCVSVVRLTVCRRRSAFQTRESFDLQRVWCLRRSCRWLSADQHSQAHCPALLLPFLYPIFAWQLPSTSPPAFQLSSMFNSMSGES